MNTLKFIDETELYKMVMSEDKRTIIYEKMNEKIVSQSSIEPEKMTYEQYEANDQDEYSILHDGTLLRVWFANDEWYISTRKKINAYEAYWTAYKNGNRQSFGELFEECGGLDVIKLLQPSYTYEMILKHPYNVNVIAAKVKELHIVAKINNETGEQDYLTPKMEIQTLKFDKPTVGTSNQNNTLFWNGYRGIMVYTHNSSNQRIQIDHPEFEEAEMLRQNGVSIDRAFLKTLITNFDKVTEFKRYFPKYAGKFAKIETKVNMIKDHIWWMQNQANARYPEDHELYNLSKVSKVERKGNVLELETDLDVLWRIIK